MNCMKVNSPEQNTDIWVSLAVDRDISTLDCRNGYNLHLSGRDLNKEGFNSV